MKTLLATPRKWWDKLDDEFGFTLDAAADHQHFMCTPYITPEEDAFKKSWIGRVWCSPPWASENLGSWVFKGYEEANNGNADVVVMLLPVRTNADWWHQFTLHAHEIRFIQGVLQFEPYDPSVVSFNVEDHCLVVFKQPKLFPKLGTTLRSYPA